ncbi:hypoxanthine phosphoribosyltransferase [Dehalogenimonas formicexedens]|uniref:Hypoxanthine phosphoribosyltransferase n=1 Tax=Dehalogenimonas formicexedens TaxID=1839801 RepID=A0A1P8F786_9CHLR|nr:hypoxanthine phosphoribosyltransferase [Dehalogenimonas formicexedens]APV44339.1 hypoxanthine phosphoribosyltransferase [Dehalogenimonas formicexedens]
MAVTPPYELKLLYSREQIAAVVTDLSARISRDFEGRDLLVIGVLKGSFIFLSDLVRELSIPVEIDFIGTSSYGNATTSSGHIRITAEPTSSLAGRHILIVEDIVDTGLCIEAIVEYLSKRDPASVSVCTLMNKPARHQVPVEIAYTGFTIPDKFVVGYGLDFSQRYRHLPEIFTLEEKTDAGQLASDD